MERSENHGIKAYGVIGNIILIKKEVNVIYLKIFCAHYEGQLSINSRFNIQDSKIKNGFPFPRE